MCRLRRRACRPVESVPLVVALSSEEKASDADVDWLLTLAVFFGLLSAQVRLPVPVAVYALACRQHWTRDLSGEGRIPC